MKQLLPYISICLTLVGLVGLFALVRAGRLVADADVPSVANDAISVLNERIKQQDAEIVQLRQALADLQIKYSVLINERTTRTVSGPLCPTCPILKHFQGPEAPAV